jgi:hypothetical protein
MIKLTTLEKIFSIVIIVLCLVMLFDKCKNKTDYKALYDLEHQKFYSVKNKKGETIYVEKIIQTEDKKLINSISNGVFSKKAETKTIIKTEQVFSVIHDTIEYTSSASDYIDCYPVSFNKKDSLFNIKGSVQKYGLLIDSLSIYNKIAFRITNKNNVEVINSNPLIKIIGLNSITLKQNKIGRFGLGPYVGYDLITKQPSAGISLSYNLIRF